MYSVGLFSKSTYFMSSRKEEIIKRNLAFAYGRNAEDAKYDLDKRSYVRSAPKLYLSSEEVIKNFNSDSEFHFLAPDYPCEVCLEDDWEPYPSFEHALVASKIILDKSLRSQVKLIPNIREAKRYVNKHIGDNAWWKEKCLIIAENLLRDKFFRSKELRSKLISTKDKTLIYENNRNETFWGINATDQKGENRLGKLLEKIRKEISCGDDLENWVQSCFHIYVKDEVNISVLGESNNEISPENSKTFEKTAMLTIGKHADNDIVVSHPSVSRSHAIIVADKTKGLILLDLGSANGTKLDNQDLLPFRPSILSNDSKVSIAASFISYRFAIDTEVNRYNRMTLYDKVREDMIVLDKSSKRSAENTLFVGGISYEATEKNVREFFEKCGTITHLHMPMDQSTGKHRGIAFVSFAESSGITRALFRDGDELLDRRLKIKRSEEKTASTSEHRSDGSRLLSDSSRKETRDYDQGYHHPSDFSRSRKRSRSRDQDRDYDENNRNRKDYRRSRSRSNERSNQNQGQSYDRSHSHSHT